MLDLARRFRRPRQPAAELATETPRFVLEHAKIVFGDDGSMWIEGKTIDLEIVLNDVLIVDDCPRDYGLCIDYNPARLRAKDAVVKILGQRAGT